MTAPSESIKPDPDAPLTVQDLLIMRTCYKENPALQRVITQALTRRLEIPAERL